MKGCVETLLKVRPGGGCGTHETPGGSDMADVATTINSAGRISGPKTPNAVPECSTSRPPELLARPRGARHPGNVYGCADIYIPRHNVVPRTEHGTLKEIQKYKKQDYATPNPVAT